MQVRTHKTCRITGTTGITALESSLYPSLSENEMSYTVSDRWNPNKPNWWDGFDIITMVDPAFGTEDRNCESAIVTIGAEHRRTERTPIFCLDVKAGHWKDTELLNQVFTVYEIFRPDHIGLEDVAGQQTLITLSNRMGDRPQAFHFVAHNPLVHGRTKMDRLRKAANYIHLMRFDRRNADQKRLVDQLVTFQGNRHDKFDRGDAWAMCINEFMVRFPARKKVVVADQYRIKYRHGRVIGHERIAAR